MDHSVDFFLLCENVIIDDKARASIINIYDAIFATQLPALHGNLHFISRVTPKAKVKDSVKAKCGLSIKSPSGKERLMIKSNDVEIEFTKERPSMIVNVQIPGVVFDEFGEYTASFSVNDKAVAKTKFSVITMEEENAKTNSK
jgi:hypothetical protein